MPSITSDGNVTFSGAYDTTITITNTTGITFPTSGTLVGSNDTGTVTNTMLSGSIANAKLANSTISGISLGSNLGTLGLFGTHLTSGGSSYNGSTGVAITSDATNANTASTIVARDSSGNSQREH